MSDKKDITICLGSSCFSRGNGKSLAVIKNYLGEKKLDDISFFHGELCTGNCAKGPILKIEDELFEEVSPENVTDILDKCFNKK
ncbi:MAG: NAD(P)H-dependent oxidoreductase subunit E [Marinifilaceae bacterium]|jgi:NADH:ubiquinone oxidoreductase subunit E|nr:NAD(P)H-dependent oxidoreductase subunit E [Marinifilaceae bacterium]